MRTTTVIYVEQDQTMTDTDEGFIAKPPRSLPFYFKNLASIFKILLLLYRKFAVYVAEKYSQYEILILPNI